MAAILIADDDPDIVGILARMLARLGHTTHVAPDGLRAFEAIGRQPFDLLITDLDMPGLSGAELVRVVSARQLRPRIIVCSGGVVDAGTAALVDGIIAKPFRFVDLRAALVALVL